jgi:hypothetical protein
MTEKMAKKPPDIATRIMESMVRMPPKLHKDMKLGKSKTKASAKAGPSEKCG